MARNLVRLVLVLTALSAAGLRANEGWARLKLGMTASETIAAIGHPLMRSSGKGFEVWIYDQRAEVVFYGGPLVGWTSPSTTQARGRAVDVWQPGLGGTDGPLFVLPPAPPKILVPRWDIWVRENQPAPFYRFERRR